MKREKEEHELQVPLQLQLFSLRPVQHSRSFRGWGGGGGGRRKWGGALFHFFFFFFFTFFFFFFLLDCSGKETASKDAQLAVKRLVSEGGRSLPL